MVEFSPATREARVRFPDVANLFFLNGKPLSGTGIEKPEVEGNITEEIEEFNDLIIGDFEDIYDNLPLKTLVGHQYANEICNLKSNAFIVFHDDDTLIVYKNLKSYLGTWLYKPFI